MFISVHGIRISFPGIPLTAGSGAFIFVPRTGFARACFSIIFSPATRKKMSPFFRRIEKPYIKKTPPQIRPTEKQKAPDHTVNQQFIKRSFHHSSLVNSYVTSLFFVRITIPLTSSGVILFARCNPRYGVTL